MIITNKLKLNKTISLAKPYEKNLYDTDVNYVYDDENLDFYLNLIVLSGRNYSALSECKVPKETFNLSGFYTKNELAKSLLRYNSYKGLSDTVYKIDNTALQSYINSIILVQGTSYLNTSKLLLSYQFDYPVKKSLYFDDNSYVSIHDISLSEVGDTHNSLNVHHNKISYVFDLKKLRKNGLFKTIYSQLISSNLIPETSYKHLLFN